MNQGYAEFPVTWSVDETAEPGDVLRALARILINLARSEKNPVYSGRREAYTNTGRGALVAPDTALTTPQTC